MNSLLFSALACLALGLPLSAQPSSQTSDGAAAVVLMSKEKAAALKLKPMAVFRSFAVAGVAPEVMGIGPPYAVPKALKKAGIATYVYLLFGTPAENLEAAERTLEFTVKHSDAIDFLNLAIFNPAGA